MPDNIKDVLLPADRHLESLRKDIEKYKESVNKCAVSSIDALSFNIGSEIDFIKFVVELNKDQRRQFDNLTSEHNTYSGKVKQCQCVKKLER